MASTNQTAIEPGSFTLATGLIFIVYPVVLISNLALFLVIVTRCQLRKDPWRILIAHTCACIFVYTCMFYSLLVSLTYLTPSIRETVVCPGMLFMEFLIHVMLKFSIAMVSVERFLSLKNNKDFGYGRKPICRMLVISWVLAFVSQLVSWLIRHFRSGELLTTVEVEPGFHICSLTATFFLYEFADYICILFAICSTISVAIGAIYIIVTQKPSSNRIIKSMVAPLAYGLFFLCYVIMELFKVSGRSADGAVAAHIFRLLAWLAFPVAWLVIWAVTGDLPCPQKRSPPQQETEKDEEIKLQNPATI